jgi:uncharacterized protein YdhG (YjbR/CyaY superfamily)
MGSHTAGYTSIDEYIALFPAEVQEKLEAMRAAIRAAAPEAEEKISYQMPTFFLQGNLVHFATHKNHIGFYPAPRGIEAFEQELSAYKGGKGKENQHFAKGMSAFPHPHLPGLDDGLVRHIGQDDRAVADAHT